MRLQAMLLRDEIGAYARVCDELLEARDRTKDQIEDAIASADHMVSKMLKNRDAVCSAAEAYASAFRELDEARNAAGKNAC